MCQVVRFYIPAENNLQLLTYLSVGGHGRKIHAGLLDTKINQFKMITHSGIHCHILDT